MKKKPLAASAATIHSTDGSRIVCTMRATTSAGTMILFGTMRRSKSVTVTATSTAQASESTSASTESPNVAIQATTSAAKTTTAMGRSLLMCCSVPVGVARSCLLQRPSIEGRSASGSEQDCAGNRGDPDDRPHRHHAQQQEQHHDRERIAPVVHRGAEHGVPESSGEQADDGGTDPRDGCLDLGALPRRRPER